MNYQKIKRCYFSQKKDASLSYTFFKMAKQIGHFINKKSFFKKEENKILKNIFKNTKLPTLQKYSQFFLKGPHSFHYFEYFISPHSQKENFLQEAQDFFKNFSQTNRFINDLLLIYDELYTNLFYNALSVNGEDISRKISTNAFGQQHHLKHSFGPSFSQAKLFSFIEKDLLIIGSEDFQGVLSLERFFLKMSKTFTHEAENAFKTNGGGAGIGMRLIFDRVDTMIIHSVTNEYCLFFFVINLKRKKNINKKNPSVIIYEKETPLKKGA